MTESKTSSWMTRGWEGAEEIANAAAARAADGEGYVREFFIKGNKNSAVVRVLDPEPVAIRSHFFGNRWYTCIQGVNDETCPLCERNIKAQTQMIYQVLDTSKRVGSDGNVYENEVKLYRVGTRVFRQLLAFKAKYGDLSKIDLEITRIGEGKQTQYQILPEFTDRNIEEYTLYDLEVALAPKSRDELIGVLGNAPTITDDEGFKDIPKDDEGVLPWEE
jgi:hypothetical protein